MFETVQTSIASCKEDYHKQLIERYIKDNLVLITYTQDYKYGKATYEYEHKRHEHLRAIIFQAIEQDSDVAEHAAIELMIMQLKREHNCAEILRAYTEGG